MLAAATVHAGLIVEQEATNRAGTRRITIRVQDGKVRFDLHNGSSVIVDPKKREVITLFHHDAFAAIEHGDEAVGKASRFGDTGYAPPKRAPKMYREKFAGFDCRVRDWAWDQSRMAAWTAEDHPKIGDIAAEIATLDSIHSRCLPTISDPGVVVKTVTGKVEDLLTTTLVSIKAEVIPAGVFAIPKQYRVPGN
jgi:hypothetical protein